jgi:hypothetical protein
MSKSASAWLDVEGSSVAFVFGEDFSAVRALTGDWRSPAPRVTIGEFMEDGYRELSPVDAATLASEARMALAGSPVLTKKADQAA